MALKIGNGIDLQQTEIQNSVMQNLSSAPSSPKLGQEYFNSTSKVKLTWNGTSWRPADAATLTDGSIPIAGLAVNPLARANHTGTQTASTISDLSTTVRSYTLDSFASPVANVAMGGFKFTGLVAGSAATDSVNYQQVGQLIAAAVAGQTAIKNPARALAIANITLSGLQTIDGVSLSAGDRVLVTAQTTGSQNGLYAVASGAWVRVVDADETAEWIQGTEILINEGSLYTGTIWRQTTSGSITIGTTALNFTQVAKVNTYTSDGITLSLTGTQFAVNYGTGITVSGGKLVVDTSVVARKFSATITGDGSTASFTITHNLGTQDITSSIRDASNAFLITDITSTSTTQATVVFGTAPANGVTYRVVITG